MQYETPSWIIGTQIVIIIASIITALILEKKRPDKETTRRYTWGYFNGVFCVITSSVVILILLVALFYLDVRTTPEMMFVIMSAGVFFWLGMLTIKRVCWAFIIATILSFNPIAYLINGIYIYRRRKELD